MKSFFSNPSKTCSADGMFMNASNAIHVRCTRPKGHADTGHEFAGDIGTQHVHIIWGEPIDGAEQ